MRFSRTVAVKGVPRALPLYDRPHISPGNFPAKPGYNQPGNGFSILGIEEKKILITRSRSQLSHLEWRSFILTL